MNTASETLLTDLYELTMAQAYLAQEMTGIAVFEFFVRKLPSRRNFFMAAGLEQVLTYLETFHFAERDLDWLAQTGNFTPSTLAALRAMRFTGDVHAMPEGTVFFPHEPILRITAPLPQAQLVETRVMNLLNFQTMVASKACRSVMVAEGRPLIDFGLRRSHGAEAGLLAARASYLAGFAGTSNVLAGARFGMPTYGTMAHAFVQAHHDEAEAFLHIAQAQPRNVVLLIDTYDTEAAAEKVVALATSLKNQGISIHGVRLDSGDLADHAQKVRLILDRGGLTDTKILASGNLDEERVEALLKSGAPIDRFAVGTAMTTSADAPYLDCAYKLQEYAGRPCRKRSEGKATWPGRKQVYRRLGRDGRLDGDLITIEGETRPGLPLLHPVMQNGRRLAPSPSIEKIRDHARLALAELPDTLRRLDQAAPYDVRIAEALEQLAQQVDRHT
ncbi:MAG: nicotinate phosphoribosyltransferase [Nitrospira sp.]|uniref:Nicotinate phosphoribosyltransferase n=1 Tax=Nitrospira defluvii TaxID=330214 RepID=A0ABN7LRW5_9BACT|nr:nicotinate phosphoribosyltransferase [Nitrospira defluvii]MCS6326497.1 nicotinate phosphoribosyltransferase [Nitrospira sp.]CAE6758164.1 Nicotinate phosphoribosyltransferase pncB2 [Nitrospira defluvii]